MVEAIAVFYLQIYVQDPETKIFEIEVPAAIPQVS